MNTIMMTNMTLKFLVINNRHCSLNLVICRLCSHSIWFVCFSDLSNPFEFICSHQEKWRKQFNGSSVDYSLVSIPAQSMLMTDDEDLTPWMNSGRLNLSSLFLSMAMNILKALSSAAVLLPTPFALYIA